MAQLQTPNWLLTFLRNLRSLAHSRRPPQHRWHERPRLLLVLLRQRALSPLPWAPLPDGLQQTPQLPLLEPPSRLALSLVSVLRRPHSASVARLPALLCDQPSSRRSNPLLAALRRRHRRSGSSRDRTRPMLLHCICCSCSLPHPSAAKAPAHLRDTRSSPPNRHIFPAHHSAPGPLRHSRSRLLLALYQSGILHLPRLPPTPDPHGRRSHPDRNHLLRRPLRTPCDHCRPRHPYRPRRRHRAHSCLWPLDLPPRTLRPRHRRSPRPSRRWRLYPLHVGSLRPHRTQLRCASS